MFESHKKGADGEYRARIYLQQKGYKILATNWRYYRYELDIICQHEALLVVVEVKTRSSHFAGHPSEAVTRNQQEQIITATQAYLEKNNLDLEVRFDIITLSGSGKKQKLEHFEDAFWPLA